MRFEDLDITLRPRRGVRHITISRAKVAAPVIHYPHGMPLSRLAATPIVSDLMRQVSQKQSQPVVNPIRTGYTTFTREFCWETAVGSRLEVTRGKHVVTLYLPSSMDFDSYPAQRFAFQELKHVLRYEANLLIPKAVNMEAEQLGLEYGAVRIKDARSLWGSCSTHRNLNFSLFVLLVPAQLRRYVICHELAHLTHMNHSVAFWRLVSQYLGQDAMALDAELNRCELDIPRLYY